MHSHTNLVHRLSTLRRVTLGLWILALPTAVMAQAAGGVTANSVFRDIFGVDPTSLATIMGGNSGSLIGAVSSVINLIALVSAVAVMLLTFFVGLAQSAHDGSVLGKRYSSLWVPLRAVIGLGFLTPLPGGYSMLQAIVLWIGTIGSGFADQAWSGAITHLGAGQAPKTLLTTVNHRSTVHAMYRAAVCAARAQQLARESEGGQAVGVTVEKIGESRPETMPIAGGDYYESGQAIAGGSGRSRMLRGGVSFDGTDGLAASKGICGSIMLEQPVSLGGSLGQNVIDTSHRQILNLHRMADDAMDLAQRTVEGHETASSVRRALLAMESSYAVADAGRVKVYGAAAAASMEEARALQFQRGGSGGWITAGAWYNTVSGMSNSISEGAHSVSVTSAPRLDQMPASMRDDIEPYTASAAMVTQDSSGTGVVDSDAAAAGVSAGGSGDVAGQGWWASQWDGAKAAVTSAAMSAWDSAFNNATGTISQWCRGLFTTLVQMMIGQPGDDPIIKLQQFGHTALNGLEVAFGASLIVVIAAAFIPGIGLASALTLVSILMPIIFALGAPLVLLAYYLPMIPYIYWTFGSLAWILLLLEAVAIAPMWAAAHVLPEGEGLAGQHAKDGWVLMVSLLLRPVLMVMGFVAAVLVVRFMAALIGTTFQMLIDSSMGTRTFGIMSTAAYLIAMVGLVIAASKAAFSLIHEIPNRSLRFIGRQESLGEFGGLNDVKSGAAPIVAMVGAVGMQKAIGAGIDYAKKGVESAAKAKMGGAGGAGGGMSKGT